MSRIFDFNKRFGKSIDPEEVKRDFVNKIIHYLVEPLEERAGHHYSDNSGGSRLFDYVAMEFNQSPTELVRARNRNNFSSYDTYLPSFKIFAQEDFEKNLLLIEIFYEYLSSNKLPGYSSEDWPTRINKIVDHALNQPISLGVTWRRGKFYPEGVEEFDEKLIKDVLKWLENKPKIAILYKNALDHYSLSINDPVKRKDVISNAFQAVEKLTQEYLEGPKLSFDKNFNELVKKIELNKEWNKIFNSYKELSKEFGRHAGKDNNFIPKQEDTEAFLYLSGLIIRLILQKLIL